jgi:hypothetical protein
MPKYSMREGQIACRSSTTTFRRDRPPKGLQAREELLSKGYAVLEDPISKRPMPSFPTGAEIPYSCHARSGPSAFQKIDCHTFAVSWTAWSHAISVTRLMSRSKNSTRACCEDCQMSRGARV